ncbi:MAG: SCO family protein [Candidatus Rokubacteria bacterium]|nr:SCO family protein [Candidatus Rokubacteria bacterium]
MRSLLASVLLCLALPAAVVEGAEFRGGAFTPPRLAPDFTLRASDGSEFRLSQHRGKVIALGFGYTFCPDVCPTTLAELAQVRQRLGEAARGMQVVYVTVDPERDTVDRLRIYTAAFDKTFLGLTGTPEQLAEVRKAYGVSAQKQVVGGTSAAYLIHHSSSIYLIDPAGRLRVMLPFGTSIEDMAHDVKLLLRK